MAQTIKLKRSSTSGAAPTTSQLALGEVAINTYDGKMYIKKNVGGTESIVEIGTGSGSGGGLASSFTLYEYTATASQTTFSGSDSNSNTLAYDTGTPPKILVYLNGVLLDHTTDYTATTGTSVVLTSAAAASDLVQVAAYKSEASVALDIDLVDDVKLKFGDDDDLQIYHDGTNSVINQTGTGDLLVQKDETTVAEFTVDGIVVTGDVEADEFIGDLRGAVLFKAQAGEALAKGDVVYISGISGNTTIVSKADADDASKMPAFGLAAAAASTNSSVEVYTSGTISGIDTSSFSVGDEVFTSTTAGELTATPPTGESSALQKIGKVTRSHASSGSLFIIGAGRSNAVPNLDDGDIFIGNSSNQAVTQSLTTASQNAGALMDSEVTNLAQVKAFDSSDYATAAQGSTADSAMQDLVDDTTPQLGGNLDLNSNNITGTGNISNTGTITSSGNISGAALIIDSATAVDKNSNYMVFHDGSGAPALYAGNTSDNRNYYQSNHHRFRSDDANTNFAEISSVGMIIGAEGPETNMGKLHVKDSDSGATPYQNGNGGITIERNGRAALNFLTPNTQDAYVFFGDPGDANAGYVGYEHSTDVLVIKSAGYVKTMGSGLNVNTGNLQMGGSEVIDSSRNITAGTITSGAITATSISSGSISTSSIITGSYSSNNGYVHKLTNSNTGTSAYTEFTVESGSQELRIGTSQNYSDGQWDGSWVYAAAGDLFLKSGLGHVKIYAGDTVNPEWTFNTDGSIRRGDYNGTTFVDSSRNITAGTISSGNITTTGYLRGPSTFTIDPAAHGDDTGTVVIAGNLQVDGTTTTINSTTLTVDDLNITLASGSANAAAANGAGLTVDCGSGTDATFTYDGTNDEWDLNKRTKITSSTTSALLELSGSATGVFQTIDNTNSSGLYSYLRLQASGRAEGSGYIIKNSGTGNGLSLGSLYLWNDGGTNDIIEFVPNATIANRTSIMENGNLIIRGNVGIGTDSPAAKLNVYTDAGRDFRVDHGTANRTILSTDRGMVVKAGAGYSLDLDTGSTNGTIRFLDNGAVHSAFDASGNLGIGTDSPGRKLTVQGTSDAYIKTDATSHTSWTIGSDTYGFLVYDDDVGGTDGYRIVVRQNSGNVGVGTTQPQAKFQVEEAGIETTTTSTTATTQVAIDSFQTSAFRSARYTIQVTNSTDSTYHLTEILLIHNGTTPQITEYGTIFTGSAEATFDADISSGNVRLLATPASTDSMTFKVVRHCITV